MCKIVKGEIIISSEVKELYDNENLDPLNDADGAVFLTRTDENFSHSLWSMPNPVGVIQI